MNGHLDKIHQRRTEKRYTHGMRLLSMADYPFDYTGEIKIEYNFSKGHLLKMVVVESRRVIHDPKKD